jgi:predicted RNA-binding protein with PUA-like domain
MKFWLFKTEPETFSWDDQVKAGPGGEQWNGVRNFLAQKHMKSMEIGDLGFFYHSVNEKQVVGIVRIVSELHPDTTDPTGKWHCVDVAAVTPLPQPVTLADVKAEPHLADMVLVKNSRLSVQPVTPEEWALVCEMGGAPEFAHGEAPESRKQAKSSRAASDKSAPVKAAKASAPAEKPARAKKLASKH